MPTPLEELTADQVAVTENIRHWVNDNRSILEAIALLRSAGDAGGSVANAIMSHRVIAAAELSLRLWATMTRNAGDDPDLVLLIKLPFADIDLIKRAFFASSDPCLFAKSLQ